MDNIEKLALRERTRARNQALFVSCGWGGVMTPVSERQAALNLLSQSGIENYMAISDETWGIKEYQRDKTDALERFGVDQDRQIAAEKDALERGKLALRKGTDEILLSTLRYDSTVKSLLMDVREYAAEVELEQLEVERQRAILGVAKEGLQLKKVNAAIFLETINKKMVEVDIAKYKVEADKANVRAILADIEAGEAEIKLLNAQIEAIMMEAEKAGLQADVATILAQIMVKELSQVKLDVERDEITAGFAYITSRLNDMTAIWDRKIFVEELRRDLEVALAEELVAYLAADRAQENLKMTEQDNLRDVFTYTQMATLENISEEQALKNLLLNARKHVADATLDNKSSLDARRTWAEELLNRAQEWVYLHRQSWQTDVTRQIEYLSGDS